MWTEAFPLSQSTYIKLDYPKTRKIWLCPYSISLKPDKGFQYYLLIISFADRVWRENEPIRQSIYPSLKIISARKEGMMSHFEGKNPTLTSSSWAVSIMISVSNNTIFISGYFFFVHLFAVTFLPDAVVTAKNCAAADGESSGPEWYVFSILLTTSSSFRRYRSDFSQSVTKDCAAQIYIFYGIECIHIK